MNIMAVLIHSFGEVLHSVEQGAQGLLAGQGLPEGPQKGSPLPSNFRCLVLEVIVLAASLTKDWQCTLCALDASTLLVVCA